MSKKVITPFLNKLAEQPFTIFQKFVFAVRKISDHDSSPDLLKVISVERGCLEYRYCRESIGNLYTNLRRDNSAGLNRIDAMEIDRRLHAFDIEESEYKIKLLKAKIIWAGICHEAGLNKRTESFSYNYNSEEGVYVEEI